MDCCDSKFVVVSPHALDGGADFRSKEVVARFPTDAAKIACKTDKHLYQEDFGEADLCWYVYDLDGRISVIVIFKEDC